MKRARKIHRQMSTPPHPTPTVIAPYWYWAYLNPHRDHYRTWSQETDVDRHSFTLRWCITIEHKVISLSKPTRTFAVYVAPEPHLSQRSSERWTNYNRHKVWLGENVSENAPQSKTRLGGKIRSRIFITQYIHLENLRILHALEIWKQFTEFAIAEPWR